MERICRHSKDLSSNDDLGYESMMMMMMMRLGNSILQSQVISKRWMSLGNSMKSLGNSLSKSDDEL